MDNNLTREELEAAKELLKYNKAITHSLSAHIKMRERVLKKERDILRMKEAIAVLEREANDENRAELNILKERLEEMQSSYRIESTALASVSKQKMLINKLDKATTAIYAGYIGSIFKYLLDSQKAYKNINRELSLSGNRSAVLLNNMISVASFAHSIGASFEDIAKIQSSFSQETGRTVLLTRSNYENILLLAKGLGLSVEEAGKMTAMMDNFGLSVNASSKFYEDTMKSSRAVGLNANKVIKTINDNLSASQKYVFKGGVKGLAQMAQYAVKFKTSMSSIFNVMDKTNNIEGAVEAVSNLQVLGGKFASLDFHTLLNQSRNDASGLAKTMVTLTKGMATYNSVTGEFEHQAGDLQRMKLASEALGLSYDEMIDSSKQLAKTERIDQILFGKGLSREQKDFIANASNIGKNGQFTIDIGDGISRDIRSLTSGQLKSMQKADEGLREASKNAISFDESWKNLLNETKSLFLPLVKTLNYLTGVMNNDVVRSFLKFGILFGGGVVALKSIFGMFLKASQFLSVGGGGSGSLLGGFIDSVKKLFTRGGMRTPSPTLSPTGGSNTPDTIRSIGEASQSSWKSTLAFGAAMVGIGYGIKLATDGIVNLATAFKELNGQQLNGLNTTLLILGGTMLGFGFMVGQAGMLASTGAIGMLLFGATMVGVGYGIKLASDGIANLVGSVGMFTETLSKNVTSNLVSNVFDLSRGMLALNLATMAFANPLSLIGISSLSSGLEEINDFLDINKMNSMMVAGTGMQIFAKSLNSINDSKLDKMMELTKGIGNLNSLAVIVNDLKNVLSKKIEVQFKEQTVDLKIEITNEISNQVINHITKMIPLKIEEFKKGI